jgi:hypothetical protein
MGDEDRKIELSGKDAAIVIRENGENAELYYHRMEDPNELLPPNILILVALSLRLQEQDFVNELMAWFGKVVELAHKQADGPKTVN